MHLQTLLPITALLSLAWATSLPAPATAKAPKSTKLMASAFGIGTNNFTRAFDFYTKVIGLQPTGLSLPTPWFNETVLAAPNGGPGILIMQFTPPRPTENLPVKIVLDVGDIFAVVDRVRAAGGKIIMAPEEGVPLAFVEDLDGYLIGLNEVA